MADYNTDLKEWGDQGQAYPDGYSYERREPPVDEWDDFFNYNVYQDLSYLIDLTNKRLDSSADQRPSDPSDGELYWNGDTLEIYDDGSSSWESVSGGDDTDYLPLSGGTMSGSVDFDGNNVFSLGQLNFDKETFQPIFVHSNDGQFSIRDTDSGSTSGNLPILSFDGDWELDGGRVYNYGGSFYMGNTKGTDNDSYDVIFKNEPSGENLHLHLKKDTNSMSFPGTFYEAFTSGDGKAHFAAEIESQNFHAHELRNMENGGTPLAHGGLKGESNPGDIWYNKSQNKWHGIDANGNVVNFKFEQA